MSESELFPGFETRDVTIPVGESQSGESRSGQTRSGETRIHLRLGGSGPPLLLLHGYPQSHVAWHKVAPILAPHFRLVIPDLPGYGDSLGPPRSDDHSHHSKRFTAAVFVDLMSTLGHDRFDVAAHDRGARVGYRMALDHPDRVKRLASLDTVPTLDIWDLCPGGSATRCRHPSRSGSAGQTTCALYRLIAGISSPKNCLRRVHTGCWASSIPRALETDSCVHANAPAFGLPTLVQDRTGA